MQIPVYGKLIFMKIRKAVLLVCAIFCTLLITGCAGLTKNPQSVQIPQSILELIDKNHEIVDAELYFGVLFIGCREKGVVKGPIYIYHDSLVESVEILKKESTKKKIKIAFTLEGVRRKISMLAPGEVPYKWVRLERKVEVATTPQK